MVAGGGKSASIEVGDQSKVAACNEKQHYPGEVRAASFSSSWRVMLLF